MGWRDMDGSSFQLLPNGGVFRIDRASKLNALSKSVFDDLAACLDSLEARKSRYLVITGSGERAFCAGTDVAEMGEMSDDDQLEKAAFSRQLMLRLSRSPVLSVAAINGLAFGGGLELAMACTLRVSVPGATFSLPEIKLGLVPAYGGTQFLPAIIGASRALELMLTGRTFGAEEALALGLLHRVTGAQESVVDAGVAFAEEVTRFSREAIAAIRSCVDAAGSIVSETGLAVEDHNVRSVFVTANAKEGIASFLEKREPRFT